MLVKHGFNGEIYCTPATARIAAIMLKDSAHIQEEDAAFCRKRFGPDHPGARPLYELADVDHAIKQFAPIAYNEPTRLSPHLELTFREAGHILGSAITQLTDREGDGHAPGWSFTGDLGRRGMPLLRDPATVDGCDVLISECTYGDKTHTPPGDIAGELLGTLMRAVNNGGRVVIPAFSLGRTQQVVYYLNELAEAGILPQMPYYVDSPLATRLTEVYRDRQDLMDEEAAGRPHDGRRPVRLRGVAVYAEAGGQRGDQRRRPAVLRDLRQRHVRGRPGSCITWRGRCRTRTTASP